MTTSVADTFTIELDDMYLMLMATTRYTLGRQSYIVGFTQDMIRRIAPKLSVDQRAILLRDILEHGEMGLSYGADFDKEGWENIINFLKALPINES